MRALEAEDLLVRGIPERGRVGQPLVPLSLNPDGGFSLGLMIGRRSAELVLLDFVGNVRNSVRMTLDYPVPQEILSFTISGVETLIKSLPENLRDRVTGLGIASPFGLWTWTDEAGAPAGAMDDWRMFDIQQEIENRVPFPVYIQNDATAACGAELMLGRGQDISEFLYIFVGLFVGGGIVLNGSVYAGRTGNAGAIGSMLIPRPDGSARSLLESASIIVLERNIKAAGEDPVVLWRTRGEWNAVENKSLVHAWIEEAAGNLAHAIGAACAVIDFGTVVLDGSFPEIIRTALCNAVRRELKSIDVKGIAIPEIVEGKTGSGARAIGAACLPLFERYLLDQTNLLKGQRV
jgi:predicted NBD/HSP70 family sugar kinase